jgi:hypothetical protein
MPSHKHNADCRIMPRGRVPESSGLRFDGRENSLFYKNRNGAQMGDLFMSLIHTCELTQLPHF